MGSIENDSKIKEIENAAELRRIQIESDDRFEKEMHAMKIESLKRKSELEANEINLSIKAAKMKNEPMILFLEKLKKMDVNMTEFLVSNNSVAKSARMIISSGLLRNSF